MKHIKRSPINNSELTKFLSCKDHTVSSLDFTILRDIENDFLITSPRPNDEDLASFYESPNYISHTDAKRSVFDKIYQLVRNYTLKKKTKLINSFVLEDKSILDIGTGTGDFLVACKNAGWNVTGIEPSTKARKIAEQKLNKNIYSDILAISEKQFDVITMWHVLEHVPDLNRKIKQLKQLLKPNGSLIVAVPNHNSYDAKHYGSFWAAYDVPRHLWHFSQTAIKNLFDKENMQVVKIIPMRFDAFYVSLLSEKYKTGKMKPVKAFVNGCYSNFKANRTKEFSSLTYIIKSN